MGLACCPDFGRFVDCLKIAQVKLLSTEQLIELLPVNDTDVFRQFEIAAPIMARDPGYIKWLVDEGWLTVRQLNHNGKPSHLFGWHMSADGGFWLDVVFALSDPIPQERFIEQIEAFARGQMAKYIRWVTLRRGIVRWAEQAGYTPEAVILTKLLPGQRA
jgi:hypothetical protein